MRSFASYPDQKTRIRGFTLLEMVLALAVTGLLVGVLVGAWVHVLRAASRAEQESREARERQDFRNRLARLLEGLVWSGNSLAPQGTLPIEQQSGRLSFWSREAFGQAPGPVRWVLVWNAEQGLQARIEDPQVGNLPGFEARTMDSLRLEALQTEIQLGGERVQWVGPESIDPGQPFRPQAFRLHLGWRGEGDSDRLWRWP